MHNTTTTSLQRELDTLRQESQKLKVRLRDLELGHDDLERNERVVASSLADVEARYSKALEEKILLEHELLDKANMEEELQRVRDELRGAFRWITHKLGYSYSSARCICRDFYPQGPAVSCSHQGT
jgi:chromosome segregation ATPase